MVERMKPLLDEAGKGRREPCAVEPVRVDPPPGLSFHPHAFPWGSSLSIGWSVLLDHLFARRRVPPASPGPVRRNDKEE